MPQANYSLCVHQKTESSRHVRKFPDRHETNPSALNNLIMLLANNHHHEIASHSPHRDVLINAYHHRLKSSAHVHNGEWARPMQPTYSFSSACSLCFLFRECY